MTNESNYLNAINEIFLSISEVLFEKDPANTSCKENAVINEYDNESYTISTAYLENKNFTKDELFAIFDEKFEEEYSKDVLEECWSSIKRILFSSDI